MNSTGVATGVGLAERISTSFSLWQFPFLAADRSYYKLFTKCLSMLYDEEGNELGAK